MTDRTIPWSAFAAAVAVAGLAGGGCAARHAIIAATATNIGVEVAQNPSTSSPQAKLGYQRTEVAIVPTNRSADKAPNGTGGGAKDHGSVLMELRYAGIFDTGASSGIYQRLAVGDEAVKQHGAAMMFARDAEGRVDANAATALKSLTSVARASPIALDRITTIRKRRDCNKERVDAAITAVGLASFDDVVENRATDDQLRKIVEVTNGIAACGS